MLFMGLWPLLCLLLGSLGRLEEGAPTTISGSLESSSMHGASQRMRSQDSFRMQPKPRTHGFGLPSLRITGLGFRRLGFYAFGLYLEGLVRLCLVNKG